MTRLEGDSRDELLAPAKQAVLDAEQGVLDAQATLAVARRDVGTDASLQNKVSEALKAVNADTSEGGARELYVALQNAEAALAQDVASAGDDEAVAKALFEAIATYVEGGGDAALFTAFTTAYNAEVLKASAEQNFATVLDAAASIFTVEDGVVTLPDLGTVATANARVAVREAAKVAVKRDELNDAVTQAEADFVAGDIVTPATAAVLVADLTDADLSAGGNLTIVVDGVSVEITYDNQEDLIAELVAGEGIETAVVDGENQLTITSTSTGVSATLEITAFATTADSGQDPGAVVEVTGADEVATSLGQALVDAQAALELRQGQIDAVAKAEEKVAAEQAELDAVTQLVDAYINAGKEVEAARKVLADDFGIEALETEKPT